MKQIRNGVFETNSSSMHSLIVRNEEAFYEDEENILYYTAEEINEEILDKLNQKKVWKPYKDWYFGRAPFKLLSSFTQKFAYAYASFAREKDHQYFVDLLKKFCPELKDLRFEKDFFYGTDDYMLPNWLNKLGITIEDFLVDKRFVIVCDGDEYCIWKDMILSGIIDTEAFDDVDKANESELHKLQEKTQGVYQTWLEEQSIKNNADNNTKKERE